jgi:hypothetical protein
MMMFLCVREGRDSQNESLCSLQFGARANKVELGKARASVTKINSPVGSSS